MVLGISAGVNAGAAAAMERNGRRSRGPSPNANNNGMAGTSPDTSSDDENCKWASKYVPGIDFPADSVVA